MPVPLHCRHARFILIPRFCNAVAYYLYHEQFRKVPNFSQNFLPRLIESLSHDNNSFKRKHRSNLVEPVTQYKISKIAKLVKLHSC